jgi:hypothetical protein
MNKQFFIIVFLLTTFSIKAQNEEKTIIADFTGKLSNDELIFTKQQFNWHSEKILIINYTQPRSSCHFSNHTHPKNSSWWKKFYSKIDLQDCLNTFACSQKHNKKHLYFDETNFLLNHFFIRKASCFAVLVINENGDYLQYNGHYYEDEVSNYIEYLKSIL